MLFKAKVEVEINRNQSRCLYGNTHAFLHILGLFLSTGQKILEMCLVKVRRKRFHNDLSEFSECVLLTDDLSICGYPSPIIQIGDGNALADRI